MKELTIEAKIDRLSEVTSFIEEQLEEAGCSMKLSMQIQVAVEEIYVNIASYAYEGGTGNATIRFEVVENGTVAQIIFIDSGIPYDPVKKEDPDVTQSADERPIGGLGIFMVKKSMDGMDYRYENNCNILTLTKKIK
jgi:Anti-sigma regulatory factor (Ser/Thr protein kinase)